MDDKKNSLKKLSNSDKVKLINNSLVLEGLTLKELSKKLKIQKKEIISFMEKEGFVFNLEEGYFKKPCNSSKIKILSNSIKDNKENEPDVSKEYISQTIDISTENNGCDREDIQSLLDSLSKKFNIKEEDPSTLLPKIKNIKKEKVEMKEEKEDVLKGKNNLESSYESIKETSSEGNMDLTPKTIVLESPRVTRIERHKKNKKGFFKSIISLFKSIFYLKSNKGKKKNNLISTTKEETSLNKKEVEPKEINEPIKFKEDKSTFSPTLIKEKGNKLVINEEASLDEVNDKISSLNEICKEAYEEIAAELHTLEDDKRDIIDFFNRTSSKEKNESVSKEFSLSKINEEKDEYSSEKEELLNRLSKENKSTKIKYAKNITPSKVKDCNCNKNHKDNLLDIDLESLNYLKNEIVNLKIDSSFIENIKSNKIEENNINPCDLEKRITLLEKKVTELENFFMEIFQGMLTK